MNIEGYCDAACSGNPGPGAAAAILVALEQGKVVKEKEIVSSVEPVTTNQRQELLGGILILEALTEKGLSLTITSDSKYLIEGMKSWIHGWKRNGWRNSKKEEVANQDLWKRLDVLASKHEVRWEWVKGHAGHSYNERCDRLAVAAVRRFQGAEV
jgi:ribonuclease HI